MAQEIDVKDLKRHRQKKKRKQQLQRLSAFLVILALGAALFFTRNSWVPLLDGIGSKLVTPGISDSAQKGFPLSVVSGSGYQLSAMEKYFAVLTDSYLTYYSPEGTVLREQQHTYTSPVLEANDRKTLVYDSGGKKFRLDSKNKTIYEKELEDPILFARLGGNDYAAVVTKNDKYTAVLTVYNESGKYIYRVNYGIPMTEVFFTSSGDGVLAVSVDTEGGELLCRAHKFRFDQPEEVWVTAGLDTLVFSGKLRPDASFAVFGDTKCAYYDKNGAVLGGYAYPDALTGFDSAGGLTVFSFHNEERRKSYVMVQREPSDTPVRISCQSEVKQASSDGNSVFVLTAGKISQYSESGTLLTELEVSEGITGFRMMKDRLLLLGYNEIECIALH